MSAPSPANRTALATVRARSRSLHTLVISAFLVSVPAVAGVLDQASLALGSGLEPSEVGSVLPTPPT